MKCLEKDRNRRYETANGLAADVQRHLAQEPVVARPPSVSYRIGKWARRNTGSFVAAVTIAAILVIAVVVSSWLAMKAEMAGKAARQEAAKALQAEHEAKSVKDFLLEQLIGTANPFKESEPDPSKRPLLERIARQLEGRFADQPLIEAQLRSALGDAFRDLGQYSRAASEWERCLAIRRRILTLGNSETLQALAAVADAYTQSGRRKEAEQLLGEGLAVLKNSTLRRSLGGGLVLQSQGSLLFRNRNNAEALSYFKESLAVLKQCPDHTFDQVMSTIQAIVYATHLIGQKDEAHKLISDAVRRCEQERGGETAATAALLHTQAELLLGDGKWEQALPVLERYVPLNRHIFGTNSYEAVQDDFFLGRAYELKGDLENW
jgi:eukaryotic-like serine/threonine-protein kinase